MSEAGPEVQPPRRPLRELREVKAAQLRAVATRWALGRMALALVFLVGAVSYALGPEPRARMSSLWMTLLVLLSTIHLGLGLRALSRVRRRGRGLWPAATLLFALLSIIMLRYSSYR